MTKTKPIYVTKPSLPPLEEFIPDLEKIWHVGQLTNGGPFHQALEKKLSNFLGVPYVSLFGNATIALLVALKALKVTGEVITTPFSFVATAHAILWNNLRPVFADIDPKTLNLDPQKVIPLITEKTSAILPVHCYGTPADTRAFDAISKEYGLKVIYDAAHAFKVEDADGSILKHGDLSVLSFHATKVFNTFEGGAIVSHTPAMKEHIDYLKNFGFQNETSVVEVGINGKMSEFNAALGLRQLNHIEDYILKRKKIDTLYRQKLSAIEEIAFLEKEKDIVENHAYFPIILNKNSPVSRDLIYEKLKENHIYTRRYFYPLISDFSVYKKEFDESEPALLIAKEVADHVLCLPIYPGLEDIEVGRISKIICECF